MLGDNRVACAIQFTACASWCAGGMCVSPAQLGRCLPHGMGWESNSPPFLIINRDGTDRTVDPGTHRSASARDATARPRQPDRRRRCAVAGGGCPMPIPSRPPLSLQFIHVRRAATRAENSKPRRADEDDDCVVRRAPAAAAPIIGHVWQFAYAA